MPSLFSRTPRPVAQSHSRRFLLSLGASAVLAGAGLAWVGINAPNSIPGRSYYTVSAELSEADNLTSHSQVRIAGRLVGQVLKPRVRDGRAVVDLQLEGSLKPLRSDTVLRVRPRSPIGVRFVELVPGRLGRPLAEGAVIPARQTSAALALDTILGTLDAPTRARTRELVRALGAGFADRGNDLNAALEAAPDALRSGAGVARAIASRPGAVRGFVQGTGAAADAADPVREDIARGFDPGARALAPFGDESDEIARTLTIAPGALRGTQAGLAATSPLLRETAGLARDALPALRATPASLTSTAALLRDGRVGIRGLDRTLALLRDAVDPALTLLDTVDPALPKIDGATVDALPLVRELAPRRCDLLLMLRNFESMLGWGSAAGNYLRLKLLGSAESISGTQSQGKLGPDATFSSPYPAPCTVTQDRLKAGGAR